MWQRQKHSAVGLEPSGGTFPRKKRSGLEDPETIEGGVHELPEVAAVECEQYVGPSQCAEQDRAILEKSLTGPR